MPLFRHKSPPTPEPFDGHRQLERVCERLRKQYNAWALLDPRDTSQRPAIRDMAQLIRLFRCARR